MIDSIFSVIFANQVLVFTIVTALMLVAAELGFHFGRRLYQTKDVARKENIGTAQGAILGLLALLLGFTFAMAVSRFDLRRSLVLDEANCIGTTYLRTSFLPEEQRPKVRQLLREYVDARLDFYNAGAVKTAIYAEENNAARLQREIWDLAMAASKSSAMQPTTIALFFDPLNDMIDLDATRMQALRAHVPGAVWLLLLLVSFCGCSISGYGAGATGVRSAFPNFILPLLLAVVITIVADIDRPRKGMIGVDQSPLIDLQQSLRNDQP